MMFIVTSTAVTCRTWIIDGVALKAKIHALKAFRVLAHTLRGI